MMVYKRVKNTSHIKFHTEVKVSKSSLVQELVLLVHAGSVELVFLVQGGHLRLEYDCELLRQAKSTGVVGVRLKVVCCCKIFHLTSNSLPCDCSSCCEQLIRELPRQLEIKL